MPGPPADVQGPVLERANGPVLSPGPFRENQQRSRTWVSLREGLEKGVGALRELVLTDERGKPWFEA